MFAPYMITVAGRAAGCADPDETCDKTVSLLGLHLAAGSLPFYLTSFATIAERVPAAGGRRVRRPLGAQEDAHGRRSPGPASFFTALLFFMQGDNWQIGAVCDRAEQRARRLLAGQLLRDPGRHLDRGGARPGLLARLGVGLPRRRRCCCWSTW